MNSQEETKQLHEPQIPNHSVGISRREVECPNLPRPQQFLGRFTEESPIGRCAAQEISFFPAPDHRPLIDAHACETRREDSRGRDNDPHKHEIDIGGNSDRFVEFAAEGDVSQWRWIRPSSVKIEN